MSGTAAPHHAETRLTSDDSLCLCSSYSRTNPASVAHAGSDRNPSHGLVLADHVIPARRPVLFIQCCCHRWPRSRMYQHRGSIFDCRLRFTLKRQPEYPRLLSTSVRIWTLYACASAMQAVSCKFIRCFFAVSCGLAMGLPLTSRCRTAPPPYLYHTPPHTKIWGKSESEEQDSISVVPSAVLHSDTDPHIDD